MSVSGNSSYIYRYCRCKSCLCLLRSLREVSILLSPVG